VSPKRTSGCRRVGAVAVALGLLVGCAEADPGPELRVFRLAPNHGPIWERTAVIIAGDGFRAEAAFDFNDQNASVFDAKFVVELSGVPLEEVRLGDETHLSAVVPATLGPGAHDLRLIGPGGRGTSLLAAFTVDLPGCPRDVDGDGSIDQACAGGDDCDDLNPGARPGLIEAFDGSDNDCNGRVDDCIADCMCNDVDLVGCWRFEGSFTRNDDSSGRNNDLTLTGTRGQPGRIGQALEVDAASVAQAPDAASLDLSTAMTVEGWIRPAVLPAGSPAGLFDKSGQYAVLLTHDGELVCSNALGSVQTTAHMEELIWSHVACTYDGARLRAFINGAEVAAVDGTGNIPGGTAPLSFGVSSADGARFAGRFDEVRVLRRAKSAAEICRDAGPCPVPPP